MNFMENMLTRVIVVCHVPFDRSVIVAECHVSELTVIYTFAWHYVNRRLAFSTARLE